MARLTIKVKYPRKSPDKLLVLFKQIIEKHKELGVDSSFNDFGWLDMNDFEAKMNEAFERREKAIDLRAKSEGETMRSNTIIGIAKGQDGRTNGTLMFQMQQIIGVLLGKYKGEEEALSVFGFNVVLKKARMPKKKNKTENQKEKKK